MFQLKNHISIPVAMEQPVSPGGKKSWHYIVEKMSHKCILYYYYQKLDSATFTQVDWLILMEMLCLMKEGRTATK